MQRKMELRVWIEGTIIAAFAMALSWIPLGSDVLFTISLGQIPLTVFALRRGWKPGLMAAFLWGMLHFMGKAYFLNVTQVLIEYPIAFTFAGFAGLFSAPLQRAIAQGNDLKARMALVEGTFTGAIARFFWHFVAGVAFWGAYAKWGLGPWTYSLVINGVSGILTGVVTLVVVLGIYQIQPQLFAPKDLTSVSSLKTK